MNQDPEIGQEIDIDVQEPLAMIIEENTALDPTPEIVLVRDLGKEMREETTVKNMNQDPETDQETDRDAQGPQARITEEMSTEGEKETSPAMGEDEVPAKRP